MENDIVKRFRDLEVSQAKLREQLEFVLNQGRGREEEGEAETEAEGQVEEDEQSLMSRSKRRGRGCDDQVVTIPGYFEHNPYQSVLQHIGHALHVCCPSTGEILYWNHSAENLFGWKDCEALGQKITNLIIDEENHPYFEKVIERLKNGQRWSGQFPFKKRSGEMFMAVVTKSPLYENNELVGVITVSSDSAILNDMNSVKSEMYCNENHGQQRESNLNFRRFHMRPQLQIASSVSSLASKVFSHSHANSNHEGENSQERCGCIIEGRNVESEKPGSAQKFIFRLHAGLRAIEGKPYKYEETISKFNQQSKIAAKVLSKLNIRGYPNFQEPEKETEQNSAKKLGNESSPLNGNRSHVSKKGLHQGKESSPLNGNQSCISKKGLHNTNQIHKHQEENLSQSMATKECYASEFPNIMDKWNNGSNKRVQCSCSEKCNSLKEIRNGFSNGQKNNSTSPEQSEKKDDAQHEQENCKEGLSAHARLQKKHKPQKVQDFYVPKSTFTVRSSGCSQAGLSSVEDKERKLVVDHGIHWGDLRLREEIGEGTYAVVYRGIWDGSDVAIKVYLGKDYEEKLLSDYKKEYVHLTG